MFYAASVQFSLAFSYKTFSLIRKAAVPAGAIVAQDK
jgi:hypothetical protein